MFVIMDINICTNVTDGRLLESYESLQIVKGENLVNNESNNFPFFI